MEVVVGKKYIRESTGTLSGEIVEVTRIKDSRRMVYFKVLKDSPNSYKMWLGTEQYSSKKGFEEAYVPYNPTNVIGGELLDDKSMQLNKSMVSGNSRKIGGKE